MLMKSRAEMRVSEITPKHVYFSRRSLIAGASMMAGAGATAKLRRIIAPTTIAQAGERISGIARSPFSTKEEVTPYKDVTHYNNYYEFASDKYQPADLAKNLKVRPWTVTLDGLVQEKKVLDLDAVLKLAAPEERIYRHRCVEGWSIVVPWIGFSLSELLKKVEPLGKAKFVEFTSLFSPLQMPGQRSTDLQWPYTEGLRMDEAMHPLAMLCFGMYGETLPNQDGAPLRLVVPWKYGFKSAKAIVRIRFVEKQPWNTWNRTLPSEYGFWGNVNPGVDHPRWSQAKERRLGEFQKRPTLMFNGYDEVASLYSGMDLKKNY